MKSSHTSSKSGVYGVCPVLSTPFDENGSLHAEDFRNLCRHVAETGVESVMIFGVASENAKLTDPEREMMLGIALEQFHQQQVRVVATVADHSTELAIARAQRFVDAGADVINILPSYFLNPSNEEITRHLQHILNAVSTPVIIQSLPLGGNELPLSEIVLLHKDHPHLLQIKVENIPSSESVSDVLRLSEGAVTPLVGWGGLEWKEAHDVGAVGVQPGCSLTELYVNAQKHLTLGDPEGFETAFEPLRSPLHLWMRHPEVLIAVEKHILMRRGIISTGYCRHPSAEITPEDLEWAENLITAVGEGPK